MDRRTQRSQPRAGDGTARKTRSKTMGTDAALLMMAAMDRARGRRRLELAFTWEKEENSTGDWVVARGTNAGFMLFHHAGDLLFWPRCRSLLEPALRVFLGFY